MVKAAVEPSFVLNEAAERCSASEERVISKDTMSEGAESPAPEAAAGFKVK